jgi:hypothetical protein
LCLWQSGWPGWRRAPFALLLVTDSAEYLMGHPRPTAEFTGAAHDSVLGLDVRSRARVFAPTLLATFPAVGELPTIVVGTPERTGKSSAEWILALLHEHFHQWQYSLPDYYRRTQGLDLSAATRRSCGCSITRFLLILSEFRPP